MDQIICTSLSHTHYWYEVGILKVSAVKVSIYGSQSFYLRSNVCSLEITMVDDASYDSAGGV